MLYIVNVDVGNHFEEVEVCLRVGIRLLVARTKLLGEEVEDCVGAVVYVPEVLHDSALVSVFAEGDLFYHVIHLQQRVVVIINELPHSFTVSLDLEDELASYFACLDLSNDSALHSLVVEVLDDLGSFFLVIQIDLHILRSSRLAISTQVLEGHHLSELVFRHVVNACAQFSLQ